MNDKIREEFQDNVIRELRPFSQEERDGWLRIWRMAAEFYKDKYAPKWRWEGSAIFVGNLRIASYGRFTATSPDFRVFVLDWPELPDCKTEQEARAQCETWAAEFIAKLGGEA